MNYSCLQARLAHGNPPWECVLSKFIFSKLVLQNTFNLSKSLPKYFVHSSLVEEESHLESSLKSFCLSCSNASSDIFWHPNPVKESDFVDPLSPKGPVGSGCGVSTAATFFLPLLPSPHSADLSPSPLPLGCFLSLVLFLYISRKLRILKKQRTSKKWIGVQQESPRSNLWKEFVLLPGL